MVINVGVNLMKTSLRQAVEKCPTHEKRIAYEATMGGVVVLHFSCGCVIGHVPNHLAGRPPKLGDGSEILDVLTEFFKL
jgi:hypothetical protein